MLPKNRNWSRLIGNVLVLIGGLIGIVNPKIASYTIVAMIGATLMISGALRIGFYLSGSKLATGWDIFSGVLDIIGAFVIIANGRASMTALTVLAGLYVIVQGMLGALYAYQTREQVRSWRIGLVWGGVAALLGIAMLIVPLSAAMGFGLLLGIFMVIMGALGIAHFIGEQKKSNLW